jgi:hypothetical protein
MHIKIWKYIIHTVYFLQVSATHVTIFREAYHKGQIYRNIRTNPIDIKYYILKTVSGLKYILNIKIQIKIFVTPKYIKLTINGYNRL